MSAHDRPDLVGLHLTVLPARPAHGRAGSAPVRRRGHLAPVRPPPGVPAGGACRAQSCSPATAPAMRPACGRDLRARGARRTTRTRGRPEHAARAAADRARARARAARAGARPADGRLLERGARHRRRGGAARGSRAEVGLDGRCDARARRTTRTSIACSRSTAQAQSSAINGDPGASCSTAGCSSSARSREAAFEQAFEQLATAARTRRRAREAGAHEPRAARSSRASLHVRVPRLGERRGAERARDLLRRRVAVERRALARDAAGGADQRLHPLGRQLLPHARRRPRARSTRSSACRRGR